MHIVLDAHIFLLLEIWYIFMLYITYQVCYIIILYIGNFFSSYHVLKIYLCHCPLHLTADSISEIICITGFHLLSNLSIRVLPLFSYCHRKFHNKHMSKTSGCEIYIQECDFWIIGHFIYFIKGLLDCA